MFARIMVPLDGSALAERALPCAERLARLTGATIHLVRVAGPVFATESEGTAAPETAATAPADFLAAEMRAAEAYLERVRARLSAAGVAVRAQRLSGTIAGALLDYAHRADTDLTVMCSHGATGLARLPLGSVADRLVRHGMTPVLLVRAFGPPVSLEHAVVPLDGSPRAEAALDVVVPLTRSVVRAVTLVRAVQGQEEGLEAERYLEDVARRLTQEHVACWRQVTQGDPAQAIIDTAGVDKLVVMTTHGRTGPTRWVLGSVADRVMRGGTAAVLLVRVGAPSDAVSV